MFLMYVDGLYIQYINENNWMGDTSLFYEIKYALQSYGPDRGDMYLYLKDYFDKKYPNILSYAEKEEILLPVSANVQF
jgi:hypothetical protein